MTASNHSREFKTSCGNLVISTRKHRGENAEAGCELVQSLWKTVWQYLLKLNKHRPYEPAIPFLSVPQQKCVLMLTKRVSVAALCSTAPNQKQPRCPSMVECMYSFTQWELWSSETEKLITHNNTNPSQI